MIHSDFATFALRGFEELDLIVNLLPRMNSSLSLPSTSRPTNTPGGRRRAIESTNMLGRGPTREKGRGGRGRVERGGVVFRELGELEGIVSCELVCRDR